MSASSYSTISIGSSISPPIALILSGGDSAPILYGPPPPLDLSWKPPTQSKWTLSRIEQDRERWPVARRKMYTDAVQFRKELEKEWTEAGDPFVPLPALTYVSPNWGAVVPARGMSAALADQPFSLEEAVQVDPGAISASRSFGGDVPAPKRMRKSISYEEALECVEYYPGAAPVVFQDKSVDVIKEVKGQVSRKRFVTISSGIEASDEENGSATPRAT